MSKRNILASAAARQLGLTRATVVSYCQQGMCGHKDAITGFWLLTQEEVDFLKVPENRPKVGRPKGSTK